MNIANMVNLEPVLSWGQLSRKMHIESVESEIQGLRPQIGKWNINFRNIPLSDCKHWGKCRC